MGSPLGTILAIFFLLYYEYIWLEKCPLHFRPKYYRRYVDDNFVMFRSRDHRKNFLKYMNSRLPKIQFTCKEESNDKIFFLDIPVTRRNNKLTRSLYRKKNIIGVYLNFNSFFTYQLQKKV